MVELVKSERTGLLTLSAGGEGEASDLSCCLRGCCFVAGAAAAPGFGGRVFGCGWGGRLSGLRLGVFRGRLLQGSENHGGCALDNFKAFRQQCSVAVVKLDVVRLMLSST